MHVQEKADPDESEEEAAARKKRKADQAAALVAKKKGNELYSAKVIDLSQPVVYIGHVRPIHLTSLAQTALCGNMCRACRALCCMVLTTACGLRMSC